MQDDAPMFMFRSFGQHGPSFFPSRTWATSTSWSLPDRVGPICKHLKRHWNNMPGFTREDTFGIAAAILHLIARRCKPVARVDPQARVWRVEEFRLQDLQNAWLIHLLCHHVPRPPLPPSTPPTSREITFRKPHTLPRGSVSPNSWASADQRRSHSRCGPARWAGSLRMIRARHQEVAETMVR